MSRVINLKRRRFFGKKEAVVIVMAVVLTTAAIKASDNFMGSSKEPIPQTGNCPDDMISISAEGGSFCIDRYENSTSPDCPFGSPNSQNETRDNLEYTNCRTVSEPGKLPWRYISQNQAAVACAKSGKRLPTNKEWLAASLGTPDKPNNWTADDCQVSNNWSTQPGESGSGSNCRSSAGAYDMVGNVWEWVDGTINEGIYHDKTMPQQGYVKGVDDEALPSATDPDIADENYNNDYLWIKNNGTRAFARGGYWDNQAEAGQYSIYLVFEPSFAGPGIGFRCVK